MTAMASAPSLDKMLRSAHIAEEHHALIKDWCTDEKAPAATLHLLTPEVIRDAASKLHAGTRASLDALILWAKAYKEGAPSTSTSVSKSSKSTMRRLIKSGNLFDKFKYYRTEGDDETAPHRTKCNKLLGAYAFSLFSLPRPVHAGVPSALPTPTCLL